MKKLLLVILSLICLVLVCACSGDPEQAIHFFPIDEEGDKGISAFQEQWYSKHLRQMKEEPLQQRAKDGNAQIYRFTLLPTWGDPQSVRLSKTEEGFELTFARLDGDGGYDPGKLIETASTNVSPEQAAAFLKLFDDLEFFSQTSGDKNRGEDGSEWILEAVTGGQYHIVVRWTPKEYEPEKRGTVKFVEVCEWLIEHAPRMGEQSPSGDVIKAAPEEER